MCKDPTQVPNAIIVLYIHISALIILLYKLVGLNLVGPSLGPFFGTKVRVWAFNSYEVWEYQRVAVDTHSSGPNPN